MAKTPRYKCRGPGFDPWLGTRLLMWQLKILHALTETQHSQINIYNTLKRSSVN